VEVRNDVAGRSSPDPELVQLLTEAERFRAWARARDLPEIWEWEVDYEEWRSIWAATDVFLASHPADTWDHDTAATVLYLLARDEEIGQIARFLARDPEGVLFIATTWREAMELKARWQITALLGALGQQAANAEPLLLALSAGPNEYVRRHVLIALGRLPSRRTVEQLAENAWNDEEMQEHHRMALLGALYDAGSPMLEEYLDRATADGRPYLLQFAEKLRKR
jgi:hypothetical protein